MTAKANDKILSSLSKNKSKSGILKNDSKFLFFDNRNFQKIYLTEKSLKLPKSSKNNLNGWKFKSNSNFRMIPISFYNFDLLSYFDSRRLSHVDLLIQTKLISISRIFP